MFTRQHYRYLAGVLRDQLGFLSAEDYWRVVEVIADALSRDSERFDRSRSSRNVGDRTDSERTEVFLKMFLFREASHD